MPEISRETAMPGQVAGEADHRIANHLSILGGFIRLQAHEFARSERSLPPEEVSALLEELAVRVDTVAKLHVALLQATNKDEISIDGFLGEISALLSALYQGGRVSILTDCQCGEDIDAAKAMPVGLAIIEMITNAAKYAHPTGIPVVVNISARKASDDSLCIEVSDDGIGLPEGFDPSQDGGVGFRLMRSLAKQVQAELRVTNDALGTSCTLTIRDCRKIPAQTSIAFSHPSPVPQ
jgi:two-component sensor histidine kinase